MWALRRQVYIHFILILMSKLFSTFASMKLAVRTISPTGKTHSGTVIFFHGSGERFFFLFVDGNSIFELTLMDITISSKWPTGDTGSNLVEWIRFLLGKDMQFPHLKVILPTAPVQPYTPLNGEVNFSSYFLTFIDCIFSMHASCFVSLRLYCLAYIWLTFHAVTEATLILFSVLTTSFSALPLPLFVFLCSFIFSRRMFGSIALRSHAKRRKHGNQWLLPTKMYPNW